MPGRIERAIRAHLAAHPDEAFTTDDLCALSYAPPVERKHRVAVLRAADKVMRALPEWHYRHAIYGNPMRVFFNAASIPSTARALRWPISEADRLAEAEKRVDEYLVMRDGTDEQRQKLTERKEAEQELQSARLQVSVAIARNPASVLVGASRMTSRTLSDLAEKARALMRENDPDAIRDGLAEIADALDATARETEDPMAAIKAQLDA